MVTIILCYLIINNMSWEYCWQCKKIERKFNLYYCCQKDRGFCLKCKHVSCLYCPGIRKKMQIEKEEPKAYNNARSICSICKVGLSEQKKRPFKHKKCEYLYCFQCLTQYYNDYLKTVNKIKQECGTRPEIPFQLPCGCEIEQKQFTTFLTETCLCCGKNIERQSFLLSNNSRVNRDCCIFINKKIAKFNTLSILTKLQSKIYKSILRCESCDNPIASIEQNIEGVQLCHQCFIENKKKYQQNKAKQRKSEKKQLKQKQKDFQDIQVSLSQINLNKAQPKKKEDGKQIQKQNEKEQKGQQVKKQFIKNKIQQVQKQQIQQKKQKKQKQEKQEKQQSLIQQRSVLKIHPAESSKESKNKVKTEIQKTVAKVQQIKKQQQLYRNQIQKSKKQSKFQEVAAQFQLLPLKKSELSRQIQLEDNSKISQSSHLKPQLLKIYVSKQEYSFMCCSCLIYFQKQDIFITFQKNLSQISTIRIKQDDIIIPSEQQNTNIYCHLCYISLKWQINKEKSMKKYLIQNKSRMYNSVRKQVAKPTSIIQANNVLGHLDKNDKNMTPSKVIKQSKIQQPKPNNRTVPQFSSVLKQQQKKQYCIRCKRFVLLRQYKAYLCLCRDCEAQDIQKDLKKKPTLLTTTAKCNRCDKLTIKSQLSSTGWCRECYIKVFRR